MMILKDKSNRSCSQRRQRMIIKRTQIAAIKLDLP